jgi:secreted Zn-dependent insulinase-like peptidase
MTSFQDDFQLYEIVASLTEKGLANYQVVIQYIYSYIDFIKSELKQASKGNADGENPFQRIWSELRSVNYLKYRYSYSFTYLLPYLLTYSLTQVPSKRFSL